MRENEAKKFAESEYKKLGKLGCEWNLLHAKCMIRAFEEISRKKASEKIKALAWVHDIGKIKSKENHARFSIEIIKRKFCINSADEDCILNHGSAGKPKTRTGKIFRLADGISIFHPEALFFRFYAQAKEGYNFIEIQNKIKDMYKKYLKSYADFPKAIKMLKRKYAAFMKGLSSCN